MTSSNKNLKKWKKCHLKFLLRSFECIFIKIGRKLWKIFIWTHRQTDRRTDAQTLLILRVKIFSPEMTEYKKIWHCVDSKCKQPPTLQNRITIKTYHQLRLKNSKTGYKRRSGTQWIHIINYHHGRRRCVRKKATDIQNSLKKMKLKRVNNEKRFHLPCCDYDGLFWRHKCFKQFENKQKLEKRFRQMRENLATDTGPDRTKIRIDII